MPDRFAPGIAITSLARQGGAMLFRDHEPRPCREKHYEQPKLFFTYKNNLLFLKYEILYYIVELLCPPLLKFLFA